MLFNPRFFKQLPWKISINPIFSLAFFQCTLCSNVEQEQTTNVFIDGH